MTGKRIKEYLDLHGIRYTHISEKTGIPMNALSPMLNGKRRMEVGEYFAICKALNVSPEKFSEEAEPATV